MERYGYSKTYLRGRIMGALGGRAAEEIVYGEVTTGAASDLEQATGLARAMVFDYGMSDAVATRTMRADNYALSEETKRLRDQEQARLTDFAFAEAVRLLEKHRAALDRVAFALLEKETIVRDELDGMLHDVDAESSASETVGTPKVVVPLAE
jgi:cell division protease FtsH